MSHYRSFRASWGNPGRGFAITEECAEIGFSVLRSSAAGADIFISDGPLGRHHLKWFAHAFTHKVYGPDDHFGFAHWFLILLFLLPWTIWLVWRSRRMKRLAAPIATTAPPSQGDDS